jgi:hypothetical protein
MGTKINLDIIGENYRFFHLTVKQSKNFAEKWKTGRAIPFTPVKRV